MTTPGERPAGDAAAPALHRPDTRAASAVESPAVPVAVAPAAPVVEPVPTPTATPPAAVRTPGLIGVAYPAGDRAAAGSVPASARPVRVRSRRPAPGRFAGQLQRARARVAGGLSQRMALPRLRRRAGRLVLPGGIGRLLCWEVAIVAMIASLGAHRAVTVAVGLAAVAVVAATAVRVHGQWLYEWLRHGVRFCLRRRRRAMAAAGPDVVEDLLDAVAADTVVETADLDDAPVAFIQQPAGITAVLELGAPDAAPESVSSLSSPASLLPLPDVDAPPFSAQLIMQLARASDSMATVVNLAGAQRVVRRRCWVTLQAIRTPDCYRDEDLRPALAGGVRRLIRQLSRDELPTRTLDRDEALALIVGLARPGEPIDLDPPSGPGTAPPEPVRDTARETWSDWKVGSTRQACFWIDGWQDADETTRATVLRRLQLVPSLGTTVAVAARRGERRGDARTDSRTDTWSEVTVRLTETGRDRLASSADLLAFAVDGVGQGPGPGLRLRRLDGEHVPAVSASLPFGGERAWR